MPSRVRRSREAGWSTPANTKIVTRPTIYGNPFVVGEYALVPVASRVGVSPIPLLHGTKSSRRHGYDLVHIADRATAVALFEKWATATSTEGAPNPPDFTKLRGFNLACWCPLDEPCHADVEIRLANMEAAA